MKATEMAAGRLRKTGLALCLLTPGVWLLSPIELAEVSNLSVRPFDILWGLLAALFVTSIGVERRLSRPLIVFLFCWIAYTGYALVVTLQAPSDPTWGSLLRFVQTISWAAPAILFLRSSDQSRMLAASIASAGALLGLSSIWFFVTVPDLHRIAGYFSMAGGTGLSRQASFNEIGALHTLAICLALTVILDGGASRRARFFWSILIVANHAGLLLSGSRSALIALGITAILILVPRMVRLASRGARHCLGTVAVLMILLGSSAVLAPNTLLPVNRFRPSSVQTPLPRGVDTRINKWESAVTELRAQPALVFFGKGFIVTASGEKSAHNLFLNQLLIVGLVGGLLLGVLLLYPLAVRPPPATVLPTIMVALVVSLTGNVLVNPFYGGATFMMLWAGLRHKQ